MTTPTTERADARREGFFYRLYTGTGAFDLIGNRNRLFVALAVFVAICLSGIGVHGFNLGIDFVGGTQIEMPAKGVQGEITTEDVEQSYQDAVGKTPEEVQIVGSGGSQTIQIRSQTLDNSQLSTLKQGMFSDLQPLGQQGQPSQQAISDSDVSGTWGGEITRQAVLALVVFLGLVATFLVLYFERWMALAAVTALLYDLSVTAGVYAWAGFEITPATVIGLLTILGYSLYDTVVVFDKVKENTRGLLGVHRRTYGEAANLAVNQTLMRSINTSLVGLLPVLGLLIVGGWMFGVDVLRELGMVQAVGMFIGTVSSVLLATPLLVTCKMREQRYRTHAAKVVQRRNEGTTGSGTAGAAGVGAAGEAAEASARTGSAEAGSTATGSGGAGTSAAGADAVDARGTVGESDAPQLGESGSGTRKSAGGGAKRRTGQAQQRPTGKSNRSSGKRRR